MTIAQEQTITSETLSLEEIDNAKNFVAAHLSPATFAENSIVKYPDATPGETLAYAKTFSIDVTPGTDGDLYVYILPFLEVPLATWDNTNGWRFYSDPNMNDAEWMKQNNIYAFRCLGQSATCYNTTAEIYKQGNVNAAVLRSCLDRHPATVCVAANDGKSPPDKPLIFYTDQLMVIDGLPMTVSAITSNSKHPYIGRASEGCYIVNRNYGGFQWIFRNSPDNKGVTSASFSMRGVGVDTTTKLQTTDSEAICKTILTVPAGPISGTTYYSPKSVLKTGSNQWEKVAFNLNSSDGPRQWPLCLGVSGFQGNNYGVAVAGFTGLSTQTSFTVKFKHMYEFLLKPNSPFTPLTSPSWAKASWVDNVIRKQLMDKQDAFNADANFFGAILKGIKTLWPAVAPVLGKGLSALGNFLIDKGKTTAPKSTDNASMVEASKRSQAAKITRKRKKEAAKPSAKKTVQYKTKNGFTVSRPVAG